MDRRRTWLDAPVGKFAKTTLSERHRKQLKRGHNLAELEIPQRRHVRSVAKKLRYATEFFASLYSEEAVQHLLRSARREDDPGRRNDVVVADGLLKALSLERPDTIAGCAYARGYLASSVATDHDALRKLCKRFRRLTPPQ
jgi:triphosphatase